MIRLEKCDSETKWNDYVLQNGGHPLQLWGWGEVKTGNKWVADRQFFYDEDGDLKGAVQLLVKRLPKPFNALVYVPRGPIVDEDNRDKFLSELEKYAKSKYKATVLTIEPDIENALKLEGWGNSKNHILPSETIILNLEKSEEELMSNMVKKTRQYIRKSSNEDMKIRLVKGREELKDCLGIYKETAKRAGFALHSEKYYIDVFEKMGEFSPVFVVVADNQPIAFLWLAISADTAYELYGGVNELGQQLRANYALKWYAIKKCKEWGLKRYDFGGLIEGGVSTFKMGWASEPTQMAGTLDKPLSIFYNAWNNGLPVAKKVVQKIKSLF